MPPQEKRVKFVEGERVLCFHGPLIYEAVIKGQMRDKVTKYLIHYNGWNKNWDEWVAESRVMKYCEENIKKQKELKQQYAYVLNIFLKANQFYNGHSNFGSPICTYALPGT